MNRTIFLLFTALLFIAACDDNTVNRFAIDKDIVAVNDADDPTGDELLTDDGQSINDDTEVVNDDGEPITDDGMVWPDDDQWTNDNEWPDYDQWPNDNEWPDYDQWPNDNEWPDYDQWPNDNEWPDYDQWPNDNEWTDDGTVWPDDDYAWTDDGTVWPDDDAVTVTCGDNTGCNDTEYCSKPAGNCLTFLAGTCAGRPQMCPPLYSPVCGCDGTTYGSECDASAAGTNIDYTGECGTTEKYSTLYYYYDQSTMSAPEAKIVIVNGEETIEFIGADLMTRTTSGFTTIYLDTVFYGLTDDGSQLEFHLKLSSIGWSIPKTVTLDGGDNYARWTRLGNELVGNLYGDVTIQQYTRQDTVITLIEINGDYLSYTPNIVP